MKNKQRRQVLRNKKGKLLNASNKKEMENVFDKVIKENKLAEKNCFEEELGWLEKVVVVDFNYMEKEDIKELIKKRMGLIKQNLKEKD